MKSIRELLDDADDGQEDCEPVTLRITAGDARFLSFAIDTLDKVLGWKPIKDAPRDGSFVELRGDSGMRAYPYRVMIARYKKTRERRDYTQEFNDPICWRTVQGDHCTDNGPMPTEWRPVS